MGLDWQAVEGQPGKPAVILVHGLGMNRYFWGAPERCRVFGGVVSLSRFLTEPPGPDEEGRVSFGVPASSVLGLADQLSGLGFTVVSWSQREPYGPISPAVAELEELVVMVEGKFSQPRLYLVGHSRGGLIARKYLSGSHTSRVAGLVTICSPHRGSGMARFVRWLKPLGIVLEKIVPAESRGKIAEVSKRLADFFTSTAVEELLPESELIRSLSGPLPERIRALSMGGTDPNFFCLYLRAGLSAPWKSFAYADLIAGVVPRNHLPPELQDGIGDGMVTAESARLERASHYDLHENHLAMAFCDRARNLVVDFLQQEAG